MIVVVGEFGEVIVPLPAMMLQVPVPSDGVLPEVFEIAFRLHYPIDFVEKIVKELFTRGLLVENYEPVTIEKNKSKIREDNIYVVKTTKRFEEFWELGINGFLGFNSK